jgi:lantibiotic biosynthesis protein
MVNAIEAHHYTVHFTEEDAKEINAFSSVLPDTLTLMFKLLDDNTKLFIQNCGGSTAAYLLGRFAHGDAAIHHIINDIATHEQQLNPDKIIAEIVHLPESRIGNILLRPVLRNYEIPYLGKSALPQEQQIALQDLWISVRGDKILLRSKKLNKEIIPRLSSAHNYSFNALPIYEFLCDLQTQYTEKSVLGFHWGALSHNYTFLPRVEYKNIVLAQAKWQFKKKDVEVLINDSAEHYIRNIKEWQKHWNIPNLALLVDGDNKLLINFKNPLSIKMLVNSIKKSSRIVLEEFLFDTENMLIKDENGKSYINECIAILLKNKPEQSPNHLTTIPQKGEHNSNVRRNFAIGSEWLYYKCYCGIKTGDKLLTEVIKPLTEELIAKKYIDIFFFIRYADPEAHIRLRLHLHDLNYLGEVIKIVGEQMLPFLEQGLITKIQTDTYKRELERYGANTIAITESFFHIDSRTTLCLLDAIDGEEGEKIKWQFALRSVDELLVNFNYTLSDKLLLMEQLKEGFIKEHGGQKELRLQLDAKFRTLREQVENILHRNFDTKREISPLLDLLKDKADRMKPIVQTLLELQQTHQLQVPLNNLLASYIHMLLNRIFKARQRTYEMVMYDFLYRYYKSTLAKEKNGEKIIQTIAVGVV